MTDRELIDDMADATFVLDMGAGGMSATTAERLRANRLAAVNELLMRWTTP
jgi:hypothetical protein